jgi:hypothetical protein
MLRGQGSSLWRRSQSGRSAFDELSIPRISFFVPEKKNGPDAPGRFQLTAFRCY